MMETPRVEGEVDLNGYDGGGEEGEVMVEGLVHRVGQVVENRRPYRFSDSLSAPLLSLFPLRNSCKHRAKLSCLHGLLHSLCFSKSFCVGSSFTFLGGEPLLRLWLSISPVGAPHWRSFFMLCLEIWYMMSILILTGHLDDAVTAIGSLSICMNVNAWESMVFIGVNAAISVRLSNELGKGNPRAARYSVYVTLLQSLVIGIVCMILVLATRNHIALIFTGSQDMQRAVARLSGLLGISMLLTVFNRLYQEEDGKPKWLTCYYVFGLPLGYLLGCVANLGVVGLWGGMIAGVGLQTLLLLLFLYRTNWNKEVEQTTERIRKWGGQQHIK
ncbi:Protein DETOXIFICATION 35 [Salvia divinorum]|uniref:Protein DETOXIFICATION 35 n=1 Tax=Salvia divinorum TaxID=28513 RepID=A0ABD1HG36_SALDI